MKVIKDYPCSKVWIGDDNCVYKWQPKFLTENEFWCLQKMYPSGFVPKVERFELEVIKMEFVKTETPTDVELLDRNAELALNALIFSGIRHGDLTKPNILIRNNTPILLDFSESRLNSDPRPDKRPEGDAYWLRYTVQGFIDENS